LARGGKFSWDGGKCLQRNGGRYHARDIRLKKRGRKEIDITGKARAISSFIGE